MSTSKTTRSPNFWLAIMLITIGTLFLLNNFDVVNIGDFWRLWPLVLIAIAVSKLTGSDYRDRNSAFVLLATGAFFLLINYDVLRWDEVWQYWPVILIIIGISIIFSRNTPKSGSESDAAPANDTRLDLVALFSGNSRRVKSDKFEGGNITAIFGGAKIDLTESKLSNEKNILDVFTLFGGAELKVPNDWHIIMQGMPILGGFEDARENIPGGDGAANKTLIIRGFMMFGGLSIKGLPSKTKD